MSAHPSLRLRPLKFENPFPTLGRRKGYEPGLAALRRGARREKNDFVKSKIFKKFQFFFPPRRQATLSWLGGLRLHVTGMKVTRSLAFAL